VFTLFCDATIYGFFRAFQILYDRLAAVKATEDLMCAEVERRKAVQVADGVNVLMHRAKSVFPDTSQTANYYNQILDMCEKVLQDELDAATFEESLRSVNLQQGWKLFTVEKTCNSILKFIQSIVASDGKGKTPEKRKTADIVLHFQKDRDRRECGKEGDEYKELNAYRRAVEGILRQSDELYRINWVRAHCLSVTHGRMTDGRDSTRPTRRRPLASSRANSSPSPRSSPATSPWSLPRGAAMASRSTGSMLRIAWQPGRRGGAGWTWPACDGAYRFFQFDFFSADIQTSFLFLLHSLRLTTSLPILII
jgi:hypothetical protein